MDVNVADDVVENKPMPWNAGSWFGSLFGSTFWILLLGLTQIKNSMSLSLLCITIFFLLNLFGITLWRRRKKLDAYGSFQLLIGSIFIGTGVLFVSLDLMGQLQKLFPVKQTRLGIYLYLLVFPTVMFSLRNQNQKFKTNDSKEAAFSDK